MKTLKRKQTTSNSVILFLLLWAIVIGISDRLSSATNLPPESNRMQAGYAPTPYSAEQIRDASPKGRKIVFQVEMWGKPMLFRTMTFITSKPTEMAVENDTTGLDGKRVGTKQIIVGSWTDLQSHASFPSENTLITTATITVPAGSFDCWLYEVSTTKDGKSSVQKYWFAKNLPGPPVCLEESAQDKLVYKMVLLKNEK